MTRSPLVPNSLGARAGGVKWRRGIKFVYTGGQVGQLSRKVTFMFALNK